MLQIDELPSMESCFPSVIIDFIASQIRLLGSQAGKLYISSRSMKSYFLELLERDENEGEKKIWAGDKKIWAVGPLHSTKKGDLSKGQKCLKWPDRQEPNSVLYVSFGTTALKDEEIKELALGLEQSGSKYIWVLRDADKVDVFNACDIRRPQLPKGFEERVKDTGMVVRDWAPQLEILGHLSAGAFMSHCGWNSCMESVSTGVPIAAWPMHSNQPRNAFLLTDVLKVGVAVMKWAETNGKVSATMIRRAVEKLMASDEGD